MGIQVMKQHNSNKQEPIYEHIYEQFAEQLVLQTKLSLAANNFYTSWEYFFLQNQAGYGLMLDLFLICLIYILYPIAIFSTPAIPPSTHIIASLATSRDVVGTPEIG